MSLIHQELYESGKLDYLNFSSYLHKLIEDLLKSYNTEKGKIHVKLDVSSVFLGVDTAVSLGIIVNELFTNSIKYAFPERTGGEIRISMGKAEPEKEIIIAEKEEFSPVSSENLLCNPGADEYYKLVFADNGKGIPEEVDFRNSMSLGLQLVNALVDQLEGCIALKRDCGTRFEIWFKDLRK
jgi:two-component sensor histidine kinase